MAHTLHVIRGPDTGPKVATTYGIHLLRYADTACMVIGAGLVAWSGAIHLDLWENGYRAVYIVGPLFLVQAVSAFVLAAVVLVTRRFLAAVAGAGFLLTTITGLAYSVWFGLFGFQDSFSASFAGLSLVVETTGTAVLLVAAILRVIAVQSRGAHPMLPNAKGRA